MPIAVVAQGAAALPLGTWVAQRYYPIHGWITYHREGTDDYTAYCYKCTEKDPATTRRNVLGLQDQSASATATAQAATHAGGEGTTTALVFAGATLACLAETPDEIERRSPPAVAPLVPCPYPGPPAPPPPPRLSVTMRWAASGEVLGTKGFRLDWPVFAICSAAAAEISAAGHGCLPPDIKIMCGGQILPGETLIQDVDFGPQPEVTVVLMSKRVAVQGAGG